MKPERADEKLAQEIEQMKQERRALARAALPFREDAREAVERLVAEAGERFASHVAQFGPQLPGLDNPAASNLAALHVMGSESFAKALREAVDAAPGFAETSRAKHEQRLAEMDAEIAGLEQEIARRAAKARVEEAQAELAAVDKA